MGRVHRKLDQRQPRLIPRAEGEQALKGGVEPRLGRAGAGVERRLYRGVGQRLHLLWLSRRRDRQMEILESADALPAAKCMSEKMERDMARLSCQKAIGGAWPAGQAGARARNRNFDEAGRLD
jgi:hypothetical protein